MKIGRRKLLILSSSLFLTSTTIGCSVNNSNNAGNKIVSNADEALENLFSISPESYTIYEKSAGTLIMPKITKAGFYESMVHSVEMTEKAINYKL